MPPPCCKFGSRSPVFPSDAKFGSHHIRWTLSIKKINKLIFKLSSVQDSSIGDLITQFKWWFVGKKKDKYIESELVILLFCATVDYSWQVEKLMTGDIGVSNWQSGTDLDSIRNSRNVLKLYDTNFCRKCEKPVSWILLGSTCFLSWNRPGRNSWWT